MNDHLTSQWKEDNPKRDTFIMLHNLEVLTYTTIVTIPLEVNLHIN